MNPLLQNVYVINMDKDRNKLINMHQTLSKYNIKFTRVSAINGKNLSEPQIQKFTTSICRNFTCTKGYIGATLSHMFVWDLVSKSTTGAKWHLILEDDVEFSDESIKLINNLADYLTNNNQVDALININCHNTKELFCRLEEQSDLLSWNMFSGGASAYLITPKAAKELLELVNKKVSCVVDLYWAVNLHKGSNPNYLITKKRYVKHDFNIYNSNNTQINIMPILCYLLSKIGLEEFVFFLNIPLLTLKMTLEIKTITIIFTLLLLLNIFIFKNLILYSYLIFEFISYLYIIIQSKYMPKKN